MFPKCFQRKNEVREAPFYAYLRKWITFKSHLPHETKKGIGLDRFLFLFRAEEDSHPAAYAARVLGFTLDSKEPRQVFTHGSH